LRYIDNNNIINLQYIKNENKDTHFEKFKEITNEVESSVYSALENYNITMLNTKEEIRKSEDVRKKWNSRFTIAGAIGILGAVVSIVLLAIATWSNFTDTQKKILDAHISFINESKKFENQYNKLASEINELKKYINANIQVNQNDATQCQK
jgi:hypothetical protein